MNTAGSYKCYCVDGYAPQPHGSCRNAQTCYHANCQYGCEVIKGAVRCTCPSPGLRLGPDRCTCVDVNECVLGGGVCPRCRKCVNTFGSFLCKCHLGFKLVYINGRYTCVDKDPRPFCSLNPSSPKCRCKDAGCKAVPKVTEEPQRPRTTTPITTTASRPPLTSATAQSATTTAASPPPPTPVVTTALPTTIPSTALTIDTTTAESTSTAASTSTPLPTATELDTTAPTTTTPVTAAIMTTVETPAATVPLTTMMPSTVSLVTTTVKNRISKDVMYRREETCTSLDTPVTTRCGSLMSSWGTRPEMILGVVHMVGVFGWHVGGRCMSGEPCSIMMSWTGQVPVQGIRLATEMKKGFS
nr:nephronectin-like isoform X2 [Monopterus albus]